MNSKNSFTYVISSDERTNTETLNAKILGSSNSRGFNN